MNENKNFTKVIEFKRYYQYKKTNSIYYLIISYVLSSIVAFLNRCQCPNTSAFGGGPGQLAHLAPTYAAVNALCTLNCTRALKIIDQEKLAKWIRSLRMSDGAMQMHEDGEEDLRYFKITTYFLLVPF